VRQSISELLGLIDGAESGHPFVVDWSVFQTENGFTPPDDYREFMSTIGPGDFESDLGTITVFAPATDFLRASVYFDEGLRTLAAEPGNNPPWPLFPDEGGFLPWGSTDPEYPVGWLTLGEPNSWTTAFYYGSAFDAATWNLSFLNFLCEWCAGSFHDHGEIQWGPSPGTRARFRPVR